MHIGSLLGHVVELLTSVLTDSRVPADRIAAAFFTARPYLGARDRRTIQKLNYTLLRKALLCEDLLKKAFPEQESLWRHPLAWLLIPGCAADLEEDVLLSGCAEAALRFPLPLPLELVAARVRTYNNRIEAQSARQNLPHLVSQELSRIFSPEEAELAGIALLAEAPVALWVNPRKASRQEIISFLTKAGYPASLTPLAPLGVLLKQRIPTSLAPLRQSLCEPQDEGSQVLAALADIQPGTTVIDACAGAGGKTLHFAAALSGKGRLIALDSSQARLKLLEARFSKAGLPLPECQAVDLTHSFPRKLAGTADLVFVDAPCSGSGTYRRHPELPFRQRHLDVAQLQKQAAVQLAILIRASQMAKPGGRLVYCTCSIFAEENEQLVEGFLAENREFTLLSAKQQLAAQGIELPGAAPMLRLWPHIHGTDGYFAAVLACNRGR